MRAVSTPSAPAAIGPYSQAIVANGLVFCSGQIALDPSTGEIVGSDAATQARQVLANLSAVLVAGGSDLSRVVRCTVYLKNMSDFTSINNVYAEAFGSHRPARATVEVARLPRDVLVEIDAIGAVETRG